MTLLEVISKASSSPINGCSAYPVALNANPIFPALKPQSEEDPNPVKKLTGWEISKKDVESIELEQQLFKALKSNLEKKDKNKTSKSRFLSELTAHLVNLGGKKKEFDNSAEEGEEYLCRLVSEVGSSMGRDIRGLILKGCVEFEIWSLLESLIVNGLIEHSSTSYLISNLIEKNNSQLLVSCIKNLPDIQAYELMCILKYFLATPAKGREGLLSVRLDWENQANLAVEKLRIGGRDRILARDASLLIMLGHDGFSSSELCLNYFLSSKNVDDVTFAACVGKLRANEVKALVGYLGKWINKYERFPEIGPCSMAASSLGLEVCNWIPTLDDVARFLGLIVDENFSSLVLGSEISEELRSLEGIVGSLANEARLCGALGSLVVEMMRGREDRVMVEL